MAKIELAFQEEVLLAKAVHSYFMTLERLPRERQPQSDLDGLENILTKLSAQARGLAVASVLAQGENPDPGVSISDLPKIASL
jgi:hypothetical protein